MIEFSRFYSRNAANSNAATQHLPVELLILRIVTHSKKTNNSEAALYTRDSSKLTFSRFESSLRERTELEIYSYSESCLREVLNKHVTSRSYTSIWCKKILPIEETERREGKGKNVEKLKELTKMTVQQTT